ncbi:MAG: hypothetical protein RMI89_06360 [Gloeomargarita sp. SKYBB_i_bin120]|nr:hypothetical protein [Gloeomargarita sp. SKYB120]MDW8178145.1 hypothetical protein [Gloeomargarita sp. SKYBB_i_bin120]
MLHPFNPQTWPFALTDLPPHGYLVGGAVRDGLLGRTKKSWDLDLICQTDVLRLGRHLSRKYRTGFVVLDADRQIARLVFPQVTVDLSAMQGPDIESDLRQRDFTINAIAWDYTARTFYDPFNGQKDLQAQTIRMVHPDNLRRDPLRVLRAYRLAAQLHFAIEPLTQQTLKDCAPYLARVAPERVQTELNLLLAEPHSSHWLFCAEQDGALKPWFPNIQPAWLTLLPRWDEVVMTYPQISPYLARELRADRSVLQTLKLRCLLNDNPVDVEQTLTRLRYSRAEVEYLVKFVRLWPRFAALLQLSPPAIADQFEMFQQAGDVLPGLVALALVRSYPEAQVWPWLERYSDPNDPVAHALPLVTGHDLMEHLNLPPGPQIGELLRALALAHAQGEIANRQDALALARKLALP